MRLRLKLKGLTQSHRHCITLNQLVACHQEIRTNQIINNQVVKHFTQTNNKMVKVKIIIFKPPIMVLVEVIMMANSNSNIRISTITIRISRLLIWPRLATLLEANKMITITAITTFLNNSNSSNKKHFNKIKYSSNNSSNYRI